MTRQMKLYLIEQDEYNDYDTYDSAVVVASSAREAKKIHPDGDGSDWNSMWTTWASSPDRVTVTCLGTANRRTRGVICSSFNAG